MLVLQQVSTFFGTTGTGGDSVNQVLVKTPDGPRRAVR